MDQPHDGHRHGLRPRGCCPSPASAVGPVRPRCAHCALLPPLPPVSPATRGQGRPRGDSGIDDGRTKLDLAQPPAQAPSSGSAGDTWPSRKPGDISRRAPEGGLVVRRLLRCPKEGPPAALNTHGDAETGGWSFPASWPPQSRSNTPPSRPLSRLSVPTRFPVKDGEGWHVTRTRTLVTRLAVDSLPAELAPTSYLQGDLLDAGPRVGKGDVGRKGCHNTAGHRDFSGRPTRQ